MYWDEYLEQIRAIDFEQMIAETLEGVREYIAELNRGQLEMGLGTDGANLPSYLTDPYFKTHKQAEAYVLYKKRVSPNAQKPADVPDYYINGYTHDHIRAEVTGSELHVYNTAPWAADIDKRTGNRAFGLNEESLKVLTDERVYPGLLHKMRELHGLPN